MGWRISRGDGWVKSRNQSCEIVATKKSRWLELWLDDEEEEGEMAFIVKEVERECACQIGRRNERNWVWNGCFYM